MRYTTANAFRTAIEQRLLTGARESGVDVTQLRKLVVFDRILARLIAVAPDRWVLKGAVALHYRLGARFRSTKDLDLGRWDGEAAAAADFLAAQEIDLGDYFRFAIERTEKLDTLLEGAAVRYRVSAELAGRRFEDVTVDVGFSDQPHTWLRNFMPTPASMLVAAPAVASRTSSISCSLRHSCRSRPDG